MKKIDVFYYTALLNPVGTKKILKEEGYKSIPRNAEEAAMMLADMFRKNGDTSGREKLKTIHPDLELFNPIPSFIGADAVPQTEEKTLSEKTQNLLIIAGASILGLTLITLIITS